MVPAQPVKIAPAPYAEAPAIYPEVPGIAAAMRARRSNSSAYVISSAFYAREDDAARARLRRAPSITRRISNGASSICRQRHTRNYSPP
jgi:hypothetical protein